MVKGLYTAYTGMVNNQNRMDVLTQNLANVNTNGYKKEGATSRAFKDVLAYKIKDASEAPRLAKRLGTNNPGVKIGEGYTDFSQGPIKGTGNIYDLALTDSGFFAVEVMDGDGDAFVKYTRDGNFMLNSEGELVTADGYFVLDTNGNHIALNGQLMDTEINSKGEIYQGGTLAASIMVTDFEDYSYLEHFGNNFFQPVEGAVETEAPAMVYAGFLETSNVSVVNEMVNMINLSRAYESQQKVITTIDGTLDIAVNQLGKLG